MTSMVHEGVPTYGTSAMGARSTRPALLVVLVTGAITLHATSANRESCLIGDQVVFDTSATSAGGGLVASAAVSEPAEADTTAQALSNLRQVSGLTWEQLGRVFAVSRRAVHFWASGRPMSAEHEEHLRQALALVRHRPAGADQVRGALLSIVDGQQVLELLASKRFEEVEAALTSSVGARQRPNAPTRVPLSPSANAARRPPPPDVMAAGEDDSAHTLMGRGRAARTSRSRGRGQS